MSVRKFTSSPSSNRRFLTPLLLTASEEEDHDARTNKHAVRTSPEQEKVNSNFDRDSGHKAQDPGTHFELLLQRPGVGRPQRGHQRGQQLHVAPGHIRAAAGENERSAVWLTQTESPVAPSHFCL